MEARQAEALRENFEGIQQELNKEHIDPLDAWSGWLNQAVEAGSNLADLFRLELKLAFSDARRMFFLFILAIPLLILTWLSFAGLMSWLVYDLSQIASYGMLTFFLLHMALLMYFVRLWRRYQRSLTLPMTRQHMQTLLQSGLAEADGVDPDEPGEAGSGGLPKK